jgi:predicted dehydrogenase
MIKPPPVRIALLGAGAIMRLSHAPTIRRSADVELAAIFDVDAGRAEALARDFGVPFHTTNISAVLEAKDIDAVIVATPNLFHPEAVLAAAAAGKHVLCEKPLAIDVASAQRMVEACETAGVILQVGFNQRYWPQVQIAKQLVESGFIGEVKAFRSVYSERWNVYPATTRYRYDLAKSGGATIIDLAIHRIDLSRYLLGDIGAVLGELTHSVIPDRVDDNVWLLLRFKSNARGCLSSDRYSPAIADGTDLYGSEGTIHFVTETINPFHGTPLAVYTEKKGSDLPDILSEACYPDAWWKGFEGGWIPIRPPRRSPYDAQLAAFCRAIREGSSQIPTGVDGLRAQEVVQAAYQSVGQGRWIELPIPIDSPFTIPTY